MLTSTADLGEKISALIQRKGLSQAELARRVGPQPTHLNRFLKGRGDIRSLLLVAILFELGIDLGEIIEQGGNASHAHAIDPQLSGEIGQTARLLNFLAGADRRAAMLMIKRMAEESRSAAEESSSGERAI